MNEIRLHGRGGQGAVIGAEILAATYIAEGKYASVMPMFGVERRGAAVTAFLRFDDKPIRERTGIYNPDCLIVLDGTLISQPGTFAGLKGGSTLVINTAEVLNESPHANLTVIGMVDATGIALEEISVPVPNTVIVGAFAAITGLLTLDALIGSLADHFKDKLLKGNIRCVERGFHEVKAWRVGETGG